MQTVNFFVLLIAFLFASCAPKKPQFVRKNKTFFYSHLYFEQKGLKRINFSEFLDRKDWLYYDYHFSGKKEVITMNVFGKPFSFSTKGSDKTSAFNAWVNIAMRLAERNRDPQKCFYKSMPESSHITLSLREHFWNQSRMRFSLSKSNDQYYDAINDAMVLLDLLQRLGDMECRTGDCAPDCIAKGYTAEGIKLQGLKAYDTLASLIDDTGKLSCCMIDGKVYNEMYSRHGLVIASLVYAYKILGKELYAEKAKKLADYFIAHNYHKEGYFDNWISIGTDSEICTGLLEVYDITGDKKYLDICENVARYYDNPHAEITHNPQGHKDLRHDQHIYSTVDQAEFVILLKNLYAFTKNKKYLTMARGILKDLEMCYDPKWKLYSHICYWNGKHDDHFFAVIQALIYIAML